MREYLKNVVMGSVGVDNFILFLKAAHDKTKGPAHVDLHRKLAHMSAVLHSYLQPSQSRTAGEALQPAAPVVQQGIAGSEKQAGAEEDTTVQKLQIELDATKTRLQQVTEELSSFKQQRPQEGPLQEGLTQQEALIQQLRLQAREKNNRLLLSPFFTDFGSRGTIGGVSG